MEAAVDTALLKLPDSSVCDVTNCNDELLQRCNNHTIHNPTDPTKKALMRLDQSRVESLYNVVCDVVVCLLAKSVVVVHVQSGSNERAHLQSVFIEYSWHSAHGAVSLRIYVHY